jgi:hypothetical protein
MYHLTTLPPSMVTKGSFLRVSEFIIDRPTLCLTSGGHGLCHVGIQFELLQLVAMMMTCECAVQLISDPIAIVSYEQKRSKDIAKFSCGFVNRGSAKAANKQPLLLGTLN